MKILLISILILLVITIVLGFVLLNTIKDILQLMGIFAEETADNFVTVDNSVNSCKIRTEYVENKIIKLNDKIDTVQDTIELVVPICKDNRSRLDEIVFNTRPKPKKTKKTSEK